MNDDDEVKFYGLLKDQTFESNTMENRRRRRRNAIDKETLLNAAVRSIVVQGVDIGIVTVDVGFFRLFERTLRGHER